MDINVINKDNLPTASIKDFKPLQGKLKTLSDKNYNKLKKSIEHYGFFVPIFVWNGYIMDGHGRREVIIGEGWDIKVPYINIEAKDVDEAKDKLLHITSQYNTITIEGLQEFNPNWGELSINFDAISISKEEPKLEAKEDDFDATPPSEPKTVLGDIYEIGEHRLLCGDSTDIDQVEKLMNGEKADMVFTDPPYGMDLDTDYSKMSGNEGSGKKYDAGIVDEFRPGMIDSIMSLDADEVFIWGADYFAELLPKRNDGSWIVWDKRESEETGKNVDKRFGSMFELCWSKKKHKRDIIRFMWAGMMKQSDYDTGRSHPTQKPAKLSAIIIQKYGNEKAIIVDLFLGSGSTLIACEQTDRTCYGMELDPKYCDVIVTRMLKLDPSLIIKRNGEVIEW